MASESESKTNTEAIVDWLSSTAADEGLTLKAKNEFGSILETDEAYQIFVDAILHPSSSPALQTLYTNLAAARSYRAVMVLTQDMTMQSQGIEPTLMNPTRAGLLAKDIFASLEPPNEGILVHKRALLDALIEAYPAAVVAAAAAGGKDGLEEHLGPLMLFENCSQTLPTLTSLVVHGCTGKYRRTSTEHRPMPITDVPPSTVINKQTTISHGHRRKFVRNLTEWNLLERLAWWVAEEEDESSPIGLGEEACETLLTIVECVGYPHPDADENEEEHAGSVGEEMLLAPLGQADYWEPLVSVLADPETSNEMARVASARAIVGIIGLATGKSPRIRRSAAPARDETDDVEAKIEPEENEDEAMYNKMQDWGLTTKIHKALISHLPQIVKAMTIDEDSHATQDEDFQATIYIQRDGTDSEPIPARAMPHPGRCYIVPFTSWRHQIVGLLAQLVSYEGDKASGDVESPRASAMSALMDLATPSQLRKKGDNTAEPADDEAVNPWPTLVDWLFQYPESSLYHVQFLRMFQAICMEHHEATLRLVLQKAKFVTRAIRTCKFGKSPLGGILLSCLNILRLRSQTLPPSAFLRQFLESHDVWKDFQDELYMMTLDQQRPVGTLNIPGEDKTPVTSVDINLGSRFASQFGFEGMTVYKAGSSSSAQPLTPVETVPTASKSKKKKKGKKKSPVKKNEGQGDGGDDGSMVFEC